MVHISELPPDVIIHIFRYYLCTESQKDLIRKISCVCKDWEKLCFDMSLWIKFDGTVPYEIMKTLCKNGSLHNTTDFTFSKISYCTEAKNILSCLKKVESINFRNVRYLSKKVWTSLKLNAPNLKAISIGNDVGKITKKGFCSLEHDDIVPFLCDQGKFLTSIKISHCKILKFKLVLNSIAIFCPNLETLHLTDLIYNVGLQHFSLEKFQVGCPKLKTLHLDNSFVIKCSKHPIGFPELETFSFIVQHLIGATPLSDNEFICISKNSPKLKFLDLTRCNVSAETLYSIPANGVEYLFLPKTKAVQSTVLIDILGRWSHSLKQVDISYASDNLVNAAISALITSSINSKLEFVDLSCTAVSASTIEKIIQNCNNLSSLHLQRCRHLERHLKRKYSGLSELKILSKKMHLSENSEQENVSLLK